MAQRALPPSDDDDRMPAWLRDGLHERGPAGPAPQRPVSLAPTRTGTARRPAAWAAALVAIAVAFAGGLGVGLGVGDTGRQAAAPTGTVAAPPGDSVTAIAEGMLPSVVQVETDDGIGSGVVYRQGRLILTAAHVVGSESQVVVRLADGTRVRGAVVGTDPTTDVAVVRAQKGALPPAPLNRDGQVRPGELAIAIGSPFGLESTVTAGIVSAALRAVPTDAGPALMIQTDAPVNPGNSGGALVDAQGRVIGINDLIRTKTGVNAGIGFAIPIAVAVDAADALVSGQQPSPGVLGVQTRAPQLGPPGALVSGVTRGSPAAKAGVRRGDLITTFDGRPVASELDLAANVRITRPGTVVTLELRRGGQPLQIQVSIGG
jgi:S1-C subfamily serine protease